MLVDIYLRSIPDYIKTRLRRKNIKTVSFDWKSNLLRVCILLSRLCRLFLNIVVQKIIIFFKFQLAIIVRFKYFLYGDEQVGNTGMSMGFGDLLNNDGVKYNSFFV
jgi:hypothetical protein